jgi:DNA-binding transcriptional LysR family regulator
MDRLKAMETFVRVVREGSFAAASDQLGLSRAIVTKHVMQLEKQLGARLINRTTRRFSVTEVGQTYFDFCVRMLEEMAEQDALVTRLQEEPCGELKVLAPKSFGSLYLGNIISEFMELYPDIRVSLVLSDVSMHGVDLVEHGFDLAIRLQAPSDSSLMARRIGALQWVLCASPAYLAAHGALQSLDDLARHKCLLHSKHSDGVWRFKSTRGDSPVKVAGAMVTNSVMVLHQVTRNSMGIALLPTYCVGPDLANGALTQILKDYSGPHESIYVLFPHRQLVAAKIRLFMDFVAARISASPWDVPIPEEAVEIQPASDKAAAARAAKPPRSFAGPRRTGGRGKRIGVSRRSRG